MTIVSPMGQLRPVFTDKNGKRLSGGKVFTYEPGTLILKATYADAKGTIPNTNPIILDKSGEADIYLDGAYRIRVLDRHGAAIIDVDNFKSFDDLKARFEDIFLDYGGEKSKFDERYNYLMQRLAQIAVQGGWEASFVVSADGSTQQQVNDRGGSSWYEKPLGYAVNERVVLSNGDIVRSTVSANTANPNADMTGWVNTNAASQIFDDYGNNLQQLSNNNQVQSIEDLRLVRPSKKGEKVYLVSVVADKNKGAGVFVATNKGSLLDNGGTIVNSANPAFMWARIGYEKVNPFMFGAVADGVTSDSDAFHRTAAFSKDFEVLPGNYNYDGDGIDPGTQHWKITGAGAEKTKINLSANSSFIKTNYPPSNIEFVGFHTVGGLGALRFTNTGNLVGGRKKIKNNKFENYTKCAISSAHNDMPYWDIEENIFYAASSIGTMGVALGRNSDCSNINKNSFLKNEVHLKCRYSGKINIKDNDFLMFDRVNTTGRAHIWLMGQSGTPIRAIIKDNKFGNEGQLPTDYPVFIGVESSTNGAIYENFPEYSGATIDDGVYRLVFAGNDVMGATGFSTVIKCASRNLRSLIFDHNEFGGTFPALLVDMVQGADPRYCNWAVGSLVGEFLNTYDVQITNANNINISYRDDVHSAVNPNKAIIMTSLDSTLVAQLLSASITSFTTWSATKTPAIDVSGGSDAVAFEQTATGGYMYSSVLNPTLDSRETWLEFDVDKSGIETPISLLKAYLTNAEGSLNYLTRIIDVSKITSKARIRIPVAVRESFRIRFTSGSAGSVRIGRVRCYQSQYPVEDVHATLRSLSVKSMSTSYAGDAAAGAAGIRVGEMYCKTDGSVCVRLT